MSQSITTKEFKEYLYRLLASSNRHTMEARGTPKSKKLFLQLVKNYNEMLKIIIYITFG